MKILACSALRCFTESLRTAMMETTRKLEPHCY